MAIFLQTLLSACNSGSNNASNQGTPLGINTATKMLNNVTEFSKPQYLIQMEIQNNLQDGVLNLHEIDQATGDISQVVYSAYLNSYKPLGYNNDNKQLYLYQPIGTPYLYNYKVCSINSAFDRFSALSCDQYYLDLSYYFSYLGNNSDGNLSIKFLPGGDYAYIAGGLKTNNFSVIKCAVDKQNGSLYSCQQLLTKSLAKDSIISGFDVAFPNDEPTLYYSISSNQSSSLTSGVTSCPLVSGFGMLSGACVQTLINNMGAGPIVVDSVEGNIYAANNSQQLVRYQLNKLSGAVISGGIIVDTPAYGYTLTGLAINQYPTNSKLYTIYTNNDGSNIVKQCSTFGGFGCYYASNYKFSAQELFVNYTP